MTLKRRILQWTCIDANVKHWVSFLQWSHGLPVQKAESVTANPSRLQYQLIVCSRHWMPLCKACWEAQCQQKSHSCRSGHCLAQRRA